MHETSDAQLLRDYAADGNEAAFRQLVTRHTDFVYSAAVRQVDSPDLACDIAQSVFTDLARKARPLAEKISAASSLAGWLHRSTRYAALNHLRDTRRRLTNERQAMEQLLTDSEAPVNWDQIRPALDEALDCLGDEDREALLLRYFKNQDFRAVGLALGMSDDAAQKRVSRAVERLREFFAKRGVTVGASGLVVLISANAVQAAQVGLAVTISAAALAGTAVTTSTLIAATTKTIAMTTLQKTLATATVALLAGAGIYEARQAAQLRGQVRTLQQLQAPLAEQVQKLQHEFADATNQVADLLAENSRLKSSQPELFKLRGEVARLRHANSRPALTVDSTELAVKSWLSRMNALKAHMQSTGSAWIPECQFLTEEDWLSASNQPLDSEDSLRRAASSLRQRGKNKFSAMALAALQNFVKANNGQFPASLDPLQPFFVPPVDAAILSRYEILPLKSLPVASLSGEWAIAERSPSDAVYDSRSVIGAQGFQFTDFRPFPIDQKIWPAYQAFRTANPGINPTDPAQLLPYASNVEQQAAIQKAVEAFGSHPTP